MQQEALLALVENVVDDLLIEGGSICEEYIAGLPEMTEEQLEKYSADQRVAMVKRYYHDVEKEAMRPPR